MSRKPSSLSTVFGAYLDALGLTYEKAGEIMGGIKRAGVSKIVNQQTGLTPYRAQVFWKEVGFPESDWHYLYSTPPNKDYFARHGVPFKGSEQQKQEPSLRPVPLQTVQVKGAVQAGVFTEAFEWNPLEWFSVTTLLDDGFPHNLPRYGLQVRGESMNRVFPNGTVITVINFDDLGRSPKTGDYVVVLRRATCTPEFEATVKALQIKDDGTVLLWPKSTEPGFQDPFVISPRSDDGMPALAEAPDLQIVALVVSTVQALLPATF